MTTLFNRLRQALRTWRLTCRQALLLLVAREDRALSREEQLALHLHLRACHACQRVKGQFRLMHRALSALRDQ